MNDNSYIQLLDTVKARIQIYTAPVTMYVNSEFLFTYCNIGHVLNQERDQQG